MSERVEALKRYYDPKGDGRREVDGEGLYRALEPAEVGELVEYALAASDAGMLEPDDILESLACLRPGSLDGWHSALLDRQILYPGLLYHGAGGEVATRIVAQLEGEGGDLDSLRLNHLLLALAWIGDAIACDTFARWQNDPPAWAAKLFIPPHRYAKEAGWELTADGQRRDLFPRVCHPLAAVDGPAVTDPGAVAVVAQHEGDCGWCGRRLTTLLNLDLACPILAPFDLRIGGEARRLRLATCVVCACYGVVFMRVDGAGGATWHPSNRRPDFLPDPAEDWARLPERRLTLAVKPRPGIEAAAHVPGVRNSQIGGHPTWEQDAEYPSCPDCGATMPFVTQVACEDIQQYGEGIYYLFLCRGCGVAASTYQQT